MDHDPLSVPGLGHLEATAIAMNLAGKRKKYWRYNSRHAGHNYVGLSPLLARWTTRPYGGRRQFEARGLELPSDHFKEQSLA